MPFVMLPAQPAGESAPVSSSQGPYEEVRDELTRGELHPLKVVKEATPVSPRPGGEA